MSARYYSLPSPAKRRILILTADAGFGHRSAANAVASALQELYGSQCILDILNPLEDKRAPFFLRDSQTDYDKMVRNMPELYRLGYDASDATVPATIVEQALVVFLFEVMRDILRNYRPDVILSTYPLYQAPVRAALTVSRLAAPLAVAVTDLVTVHRLWFSTSVDICFAPTDPVRDLALDSGMSAEQIIVTGMPVNPNIAREKRTQAQIRVELGLQPTLLTIVAVGSRRVDHFMDALNVINHFGMPVQLIVAAGKDEVLFRQLQGVDWHIPVKLFEYHRNIPELLKAADLVVCKAGGLIVTEALACGRPLMLVDAIAGQETGNAEYVVSHGAGDLTLEPIAILEMLSDLFREDGKLLHERTVNAQRLGRPNAAYDIAQVVWQVSQSHAVDRRMNGRRRLIDMLSKNHVRWEEDI